MEQNAIKIIRQRIADSMLDEFPPGEGNPLDSMLADGSWADIDYQSVTGHVDWLPLRHLKRLRGAALAFRRMDAGPAAASILEGIHRGLGFWFARKPLSSGWWFNMIGTKEVLAQLGLLLDDDLAPEPSANIIGELSLVPRFTGTNRMWIVQQMFWRGILARDSSLIRKGLDNIIDLLKVTDEEGLQVDGSFHQHGPQLYNGGYGFLLLKDAVTCARFVQGTPFAFSDEALEPLRLLMLEGNRWMMRGSFFDWSACGRAASRPRGSSRLYAGRVNLHLDLQASSLGVTAWMFLEILDSLAKLQPNYAPDYQALARHIAGGLPAPVRGNRIFYRSDFMVHQQDDYYLSVKMCSARTWGTECGGGENLKGRWLPFGLTWIITQDLNLDDFLPCLDWSILPGVTGTAITHFSHLFGDWWSQGSRFVGGVSNGRQGVAAMLMDGNLLHGHPSIKGNVQNEKGELQGDEIEIEMKVYTGELVQARKACFLFNGEFVALGTDIHSPQRLPIHTGVNQCLLQGELVVDGVAKNRGDHHMDGASRVWHDGVGYLFPAGGTVRASNRSVTGSWKDINSNYSDEPMVADMFKIWIDHGIPSDAASYQYVVRPGVDCAAFDAYAADVPIRVLHNTAEIQAVTHVGLGVTGAVFYTPGALSLPSGTAIEVDQPVALLLEESAGATHLTLSSPEQKTGPVRVTFSFPTGNGSPEKRELDVPLPGGQRAGSSVSIQINRSPVPRH